MNSSTSSSRIAKKFWGSSIRSIFSPLLACLVLLGLYQALIFGGFISPTGGINQWQGNVIKAQQYAYDTNPTPKMVLVGSSLTSNIRAEYIGSQVANLGLAGGSTQTGLEIVKKKKSKPSILLVEVNDTIDRKIDGKLVDSLYQPLLHFARMHLPIFKEEFKPVSVLISYFKNKYDENKKVTTNQNEDKEQIKKSPARKKVIEKLVNENRKELDQEVQDLLRKQAEYIKVQIAEIKKDGVRVALFDVPGEPLVNNTLRKKQVRELMRSLFPTDSFEWLQEPSREWVTSDGIHLIEADAKDYAAFLREQLLNTAS